MCSFGLWAHHSQPRIAILKPKRGEEAHCAIGSPTALPSSREVCDCILYRKKFALLQREAERNRLAIVHLNDGTKHVGMATLFSQFHLLMISAFTTVE